MLEDAWKNSFITLLLFIGAVYFFLQYITPVVGPGIVALIFVTAFGPFLQKLKKKFHIHRQIGAALLLLIFLGILGGVIAFLFSFILGSLPEAVNLVEEVYGDATREIHELSTSIGSTLKVNGGEIEDFLLTQADQIKGGLTRVLTNGVMNNSFRILGKVGELLFFIGAFLISVIMLARDYDDFMNCLLEKEICQVPLSVFCGIIRYLATLVKAQVIILPIIGGICSFVLTLLGIKHGIFFGILAGFLDALPMIGTGIVLVPMAFFSFTQGEILKALIIVILYGGCVLIREFMEPKLIGKHMGIPPIALLLAIYGGVKLFGVWGIVKGPLGYLIVQMVVDIKGREFYKKSLL